MGGRVRFSPQMCQTCPVPAAILRHNHIAASAKRTGEPTLPPVDPTAEPPVETPPDESYIPAVDPSPTLP